MAMITSSEYGIVAVNNSVLSKMVIDNMLSLDKITPCNKKGKPLKMGFFKGYNEFYNSVEISEKPDGIYVRAYALFEHEDAFQEVSERLFNLIEEDFTMLCLDEPIEIVLNIRGLLRDKKVEPLNVEMVRKNAQ